MLVVLLDRAAHAGAARLAHDRRPQRGAEEAVVLDERVRLRAGDGGGPGVGTADHVAGHLAAAEARLDADPEPRPAGALSAHAPVAAEVGRQVVVNDLR